MSSLITLSIDGEIALYQNIFSDSDLACIKQIASFLRANRYYAEQDILSEFEYIVQNQLGQEIHAIPIKAVIVLK